ncbi:hypothetical protein QTP88_010686 [Uroleucon formosanum]
MPHGYKLILIKLKKRNLVFIHRNSRTFHIRISIILRVAFPKKEERRQYKMLFFHLTQQKNVLSPIK